MNKMILDSPLKHHNILNFFRSYADAFCLEGRRDRKAYGLVAPCRVRDDEVGGHRIEPALDAFDRGIERLQVYAHE